MKQSKQIRPIPAIMSEINRDIAELSRRDIPVVDYDHPENYLYGLKIVKGKCVFLTEALPEDYKEKKSED